MTLIRLLDGSLFNYLCKTLAYILSFKMFLINECFPIAVTQVSSNLKRDKLSVTSKIGETASLTCELTQDASYIHWYKHQKGTAPRRLLYYDVYYSKTKFDSGINEAKYSVYKVTGRSYTFAILTVEDSDSGMYYCAVWEKHVGSDFLCTALEIWLVGAKSSPGTNPCFTSCPQFSLL